MKHHTKDPAKRSEHVVNHMARLYELQLFEMGLYPCEHEFVFWLSTYHEVLKEIAGEQDEV